MLYRPVETVEIAQPRPGLAARIWTGLLAVLASVTRQSADRQYLDGLRPQELEDLGLRRTEARDYTFFL